jgi:hypothetical protein
MKIATPTHLNLFQANQSASPFTQETRNSNAALLLPLFVPVTPLLRYSYKKMGGVPHPVGRDETRNTGFSLCAVSQNGTYRLKPVSRKPITHLLEAPRGFNTPDPVDIVDTNLQCFLSLTDFPSACPQKTPNVFYHLRAIFHLSTSVFYHLQKRRGGGGQLLEISNQDERRPEEWMRVIGWIFRFRGGVWVQER